MTEAFEIDRPAGASCEIVATCAVRPLVSGRRQGQADLMTTTPQNITQVFSTFDDLWSPRSLATINDTEVRPTKVQGDYVWHRHPDSDEMFIVIEGHLAISLRDGGTGEERTVELHVLDTFVVPMGIEHRPSSPGGASILVLDRTGTLTTGDFAGDIPDHITSTSAGVQLN